MNDAIRKMIVAVEQVKSEKPSNDFLDDVLDGKPYMRAETPGFRAALRRRRAERDLEASRGPRRGF